MRFLTRQDNQQVHNGGGGGPEGLLGAARAEGSQLLAAAKLSHSAGTGQQ